MKIRDLMSAPVVSVTPSASIGEAAKVMLDHRYSGLPVINADGELMGIVTESDFLRRVELDTDVRRPRWLDFLRGAGRVAEEYARTNGRRVEEVMHYEVVTCSPDDPLKSAVDAMLAKRIKRLPVVENGRVVGIIARSDLLRALAPLVASQSGVPTTDEEIQNQIEARLKGEVWSSGLVVATVNGGVVTLEGTVFDDRQRQAMRVLVENVPGVTQVIDRVMWIEPSTAALGGIGGVVMDRNGDA
jgi:CBS domain-containing protein